MPERDGTSEVQQSNRAQARPRRSRFWTVTVVAAAIAIVLIVVTWRAGWPGSEPDVGTPVSPRQELSPDEAAFYAYLDPRLRALTAEASAAAELGRSKSRNLFAFQRHRNRIRDVSSEIDRYLQEHATPPRFGEAISQYQQGIAAVRQAMDDAQTGLLRLDWERIATAIPVMTNGAGDHRNALVQLELAAGIEHPAIPSPIGE